MTTEISIKPYTHIQPNLYVQSVDVVINLEHVQTSIFGDNIANLNSHNPQAATLYKYTSLRLSTTWFCRRALLEILYNDSCLPKGKVPRFRSNCIIEPIQKEIILSSIEVSLPWLFSKQVFLATLSFIKKWFKRFCNIKVHTADVFDLLK